MRTFSTKTTTLTKYAVLVLIAISFFLHAVNINYNTPFSDEAVYIIVGKMGFFDGDWSSYNAVSWMGGHPFFYPTMTAIAYSIGGIAGSRYLNVAFFALSTFLIYKITAGLVKDEEKGKIAGIISAFVFAASSSSYYVARLATYDMPALFFMLAGIFFSLSWQKTKNTPTRYFLAGLFFFLSFATKLITVIYLPVFVLFFFLLVKKKKAQKVVWIKYFLFPLVSLFIFYSIFSIRPQLNYIFSQISTVRSSTTAVLFAFFKDSWLILNVWLIASIGMLLKNKYKHFTALNILAFLIIILHIVTNRLATLDKHILFFATFISIMAGVGMEALLTIKERKLSKPIALALVVFLLTYAYLSFFSAKKYNALWKDSTYLLYYFMDNIEYNDLVLTELGPPLMLATYRKNPPLNYTTFNWFEYKNVNGERAYKKAIEDKYFDYVQINSYSDPKVTTYANIYTGVITSIDKNYELVFKKDNYYVYKKN